MASRRPLTALRAGVALTILSLLICLWGAPAQAYDNASSHKDINQAAAARYLARAAEIGLPVDFAGQASLGWEVTAPGLLSIENVEARKTIADWLVHGGYSADEPELYMSFRHFYDPLGIGGYKWLTDHLDDILALSPAGENPMVDAREWAMNHPDNRYSYAQARKYLESAMHDTETRPGEIFDYGKAWRAVGETMHLIADMTVPAHVRNDSHPYLQVRSSKLGDPDPFESTTRSSQTRPNLNGTPSPAITYWTEEIDPFFETVARWTSANFYSVDTVQRWWGGGLTANGQPEYPSPKLPGEAVKGYYMRAVDGTDMPMARKSPLLTLGIITQGGAKTYGYIDDRVVRAQRARLVPTAVEAAATVINAFLPRFAASIDRVEPAAEGGYLLYGDLAHVATSVWPSAPTVNNGAFVLVNDREPYYIQSGKGIVTNGVRAAAINALPGDKIRLGWDLGGYRVISEEFQIKPQIAPAGSLSTDVILMQNKIHVDGSLSFYGPEPGDTLSRVENKPVFSWNLIDALIFLKSSATKSLTVDANFDYDVTGGQTWEHGTSSIGDKVRHQVSNFRYTVSTRTGPQAVLSTREQDSGSFSFTVPVSAETGQALLVDVSLTWEWVDEYIKITDAKGTEQVVQTESGRGGAQLLHLNVNLIR